MSIATDDYLGIDYCYGMANGKKCKSDAMCSSGFCNDEKCEAKKDIGEVCSTTEDDQCLWSLECGKKSYWDQETCKKNILSFPLRNDSANACMLFQTQHFYV